MKQIFTHDLGDLHRRRDYAGWVEAKRDLKLRESNDPWFELNTRMMEAVQMGDDEEAKKIQILIDKVGGPPPGVKQRREYAILTEIYNTPMSISRAENIAKADQAKRNREIWKQRIAQREANEKAEEDAHLDPLREDREAEVRRELFMKRVYKNVEEEKKKAMAKAEELLGENKDKLLAQNQIEKAWAVAKKEMEEMRLRQSQKSLQSKGLPMTDDAANTSDNAVLPPRRKVTHSENGRPRVPGDRDVKLGEIALDHISESSDITSGSVRIRVNSSYNSNESDAAVRKHTFQYTVQITNQSPTETIQLTRRRFEIQTIGSSKKDLVEGEGVTGRQPILKPGETFNYTSLAPLNVRPLGTTIVAARMRGTYFYKVIGGESTMTTNEESERDAELGTFHFVFPPEQRVVPFVGNYDDDEDDDDDEVAGEDMSNYI
jgi:ApaG protein